MTESAPFKLAPKQQLDSEENLKFTRLSHSTLLQ